MLQGAWRPQIEQVMVLTGRQAKQSGPSAVRALTGRRVTMAYDYRVAAPMTRIDGSQADHHSCLSLPRGILNDERPMSIGIPEAPLFLFVKSPYRRGSAE